LAARKTTWLIALDAKQHQAECRGILAAAGYSIEDIGTKDEIIAIP
jgi:hypothetical protein